MEQRERRSRVLIVDDEPNICALLAATLRLVDFDVSQVHGHLDGLQVAQRLRREGRDMPILFLTARHAVEDRVAGLTAGGDDYVTKPTRYAAARIRWTSRRSSAASTRQSRAARLTPTEALAMP